MAGVSDGEREQVIEELRRRAAAGHLTADQLTERLHRARTVITRAGLDGILLNLPGGPAEPSDRPWALPDAGPPPAPAPPPPPAPPPVPASVSEPAPAPAPPPAPGVEPPAPAAPPGGPWPTPTSAPPAAPGSGGPWPTSTSAPPGSPHWGPWAMPTAAPPPPETPVELGVGLWPLPKKPAAEPPVSPQGRVANRTPVEGKRRPVVGVVGLLTIGLAATWWIGDMADNASEVSDRLPDPPAVEAPAPPLTASTTTTTTTRPTGTTIPHLDGWETLVVGEDIQPGILTSDADGNGNYCGWSRVITVDEGRSAEGLANGGGPRPVVEVKATDRVLLAHSCGPWEAYVPADTPATTMNDGDWLVGADVAPGRYRTPSTDPDCYWERGRDFTRDPAAHLENNLGDGRTVVDLVDGERFTTYQCGAWVRD